MRVQNLGRVVVVVVIVAVVVVVVVLVVVVVVGVNEEQVSLSRLTLLPQVNERQHFNR